MSVLRRKFRRREDQYTQIANAAARDMRLSRAARGLLVELMSHSDGWDTSETRLAEVGVEGRSAIRTMIKELETFGYLSRGQANVNGVFGAAEWLVDDVPTVVGLPNNGLPNNGLPNDGLRATKKEKTKNENLKEIGSPADSMDKPVGTVEYGPTLPVIAAREVARAELRKARQR